MDVDAGGWVGLCSYDDIKNLEGKLKTLIDSVVPSIFERSEEPSGNKVYSQNRATKDMVKMILENFWNELGIMRDDNSWKRSSVLRQLKVKK